MQQLTSQWKQPSSDGSALDYLLSDLLLGAVPPGVVHPFGEVLDEAYPLGDAHLLLFRQLCGQPGLAGGGVEHRHMELLLQHRGAWGQLKTCPASAVSTLLC